MIHEVLSPFPFEAFITFRAQFEIELPKLERAGSHLFYSVEGDGRPPIVFLHPLPFDHRIWMHQTFEFSFAHRVLALDFPGLGYSEASIRPCTILSLSDDLNDIMKIEGIEEAVVVGLSLGGAVAQQFALKYPEKVRKLILAGTSCTYAGDEIRKKFTERVSQYESPAASEHYTNNLKILFSSKFLESEQGNSILRNYSSLGARIDFKGVAKLFGALLSFDIEEKIGSIGAPTLVIAGDEDRVFSDSKKISEKIPNAKFFPIQGAGHIACYEKPKLFNTAIKHFLESDS